MNNKVIDHMNPSPYSYRRDIDGLRAVAVLLVLFYHLQWHFFSAGFVGVDVFFVISGYLITKHLLSDIQNHRFSLKNFYLKRARRIFPALSVVLIFTSLACLILLLPQDLKNYGSSLIATLGFFSNFYFWRSVGCGYFSIRSSLFPLLHTWSLAIEEQFYLLWPLFLFFFKRYTKDSVVFYATLSIALLSFFLYYGFSFSSRSEFLYYSPFTRAFELLMGALLAIRGDRLRLPNNRIIQHAISLVGFFSIVLSSIFFVGNHSVLGCRILLPCIGTAFLIWIGRAKMPPIANALLSNTFFVFIGLISYSLYLWHWPIITLAHYESIPLDFKNSLVIALSSILLSTLTWHFIEKPFRFQLKYTFLKTMCIALFFIWIPSAIFGVALEEKTLVGFNKMPTGIIKKTSPKAFYGLLSKQSDCFGHKGVPVLPSERQCMLGNLNIKNPNVLIAGDSHAFSDVGMLNVFLKNAALKGYVVAFPSDAFLPGKVRYDQSSQQTLTLRNDYIAQLIKTHRYQYVVLGGWWVGYKTFPTKGNITNLPYGVLRYGMKNAIKMIIKSGAVPVILLDVPSLFHVRRVCGFEHIGYNTHCYNSKKKVDAEQFASQAIILKLKQQYPQIILIDPKKIICDSRRCYSSINNTPLYMTDLVAGAGSCHLNAFGSALIGKLYLKKYGNPFLRFAQWIEPR